MYTRTTADYTPTRNGSRDQNKAFDARAEMMRGISKSRYRQPRRAGFHRALARLAAAVK